MTILQIGGGVLAVLALAAAGTLLLPRHVHVERSARVALPPADVLALASSTEGYQTFNPYRSTDPDLRIDPFGPAAGVGSGFRFEGREGKGTQTVAEVGATHVRYDIDLGAMGRPSQRLDVTPDGDGARVVWSMEADMGLNPVARVMGLFMDGLVGKSFERGLANLNAAGQA